MCTLSLSQHILYVCQYIVMHLQSMWGPYIEKNNENIRPAVFANLQFHLNMYKINTEIQRGCLKVTS